MNTTLTLVSLLILPTTWAIAQEAEQKELEKLQQTRLIMQIMNGSQPTLTPSRVSVGSVEIPEQALQMMRIISTSDLQLSEEQTSTFSRLIQE